MEIQGAAYHRNGIGGAPFYVAYFTDDRDGDVQGRQMVGIVFPEYEMATAVFDLHLLSEGVIAFGENSYRGDHFDAELRKRAPKVAEEEWEARRL